MSRSRPDKHPTLLALTSSAMMLPGYQQAQAESPPTDGTVGLRLSSYQEDDITASKAFNGPSERYDIDIAQFHLLAPVGDDWTLALDVSYEDMSGASPWFVGMDADGSAKVVMSGASIEDQRTAISVTTRYYYDRGNVAFNYARSDENDYKSDAIGLDASFNSKDNLTTWSAAISGSKDDIEPTQGQTPTNTLKDEKDIRFAWVGVTRIVSRRAILRFGLSYTYREGFLTDPYKLNDRRPDQRKEWVLSAGWRQHFVGANGSLHADYRYFDDDWGIKSHAIDLAWHQTVNQHLRVVPFVRYYSQSQADFFANFVDFSADYYADDYRLSAFGAWSGGLRGIVSLDDWQVTLSGERYVSKASWSLDEGEESPGLVKYWRYTVGFDYRF